MPSSFSSLPGFPVALDGIALVQGSGLDLEGVGGLDLEGVPVVRLPCARAVRLYELPPKSVNISFTINNTKKKCTILWGN